jgi:hypothetical protein
MDWRSAANARSFRWRVALASSTARQNIKNNPMQRSWHDALHILRSHLTRRANHRQHVIIEVTSFFRYVRTLREKNGLERTRDGNGDIPGKLPLR